MVDMAMARTVEKIDGELQRAALALEIVMTGGNHLANALIQMLGGDFAKKYPPDMDQEMALRELYTENGIIYDTWTCWSAIMRAREVAGLK